MLRPALAVLLVGSLSAPSLAEPPADRRFSAPGPIRAGTADRRFQRECVDALKSLPKRDPALPARLLRLQSQLSGISSPAARAAYFHLQLRYTRVREQYAACRRFGELLQQTVDPDPVERAQHLYALAAHRFWLQRKPEDISDVTAELLALQKAHPRPDILSALLQLQAQKALHQSDKALAASLQRARLALAATAEEQARVWLSLAQIPDGSESACWEQAFRCLIRCPAGKRRDLALELLRGAPDRNALVRVSSLLPAQDQDVLLTSAEASSRLLKEDEQLPLWESLARSHPDLEVRIRCLAEVARCQQKLGHFEQAEALLQQALSLRQQHPRPDPNWGPYNSQLHHLVYELSRVYSDSRRLREGLAVLERALDSGWATTPAQQMRLRREALSFCNRLLDPERQRVHWLALEQILDQLSPEEQPRALEILSDWLPAKIEETPKGLEILGRLQSFYREQLAELRAPRERALALYNLGRLLKHTGDRAGQLQCFSEMLELCNQFEDTFFESFAIQELAETYQGRERVAFCRSQLERSRPLEEWLRNKLTDVLAAALTELEDPEALTWARRAFEVNWKRLGNRHYALVQLSQTQLRLKRYQEALETWKFGLASPDFSTSERAAMLASLAGCQFLLNDREAARLTSREAVLAHLAGERPQLAWSSVTTWMALEPDWLPLCEQVLQFYSTPERLPSCRQARSWLLGAALERLEKTRDWDQGVKLLEQYADEELARHRLATHWREIPAWAGHLGAAPQAASSASMSVAALLDQLRLTRPDWDQRLQLRSTHLSALQAQLRPDQRLVSYFPIGDQIYLVCLDSQKSFWKTSLISRERRKTLVAQCRRELSQPGPNSNRTAAEAALWDALLGPITDIQDKQLLLVPDEELWNLPWTALRDSRSRPLGDQARVALLSSGDLLRLAAGSWRPYQLSRPLVLGAPPEAGLPEAEMELREVARLLPESRLFIGDQATPAALSGGPGLLHIATHGFYKPEQPLRSTLQLHGGPVELARLEKLPDDCLVSLSCCYGLQSGGSGEPVSLATAFSAAGARTVVAFQWRVEDRVARRFFLRFYQELVDGRSPGQAFRSAQQDVRREYPETSAWGGFVLLGNPN